ncbi:8214_t:CDS:2 [Cetraspora pellucida]|uniref:8214_t:CDS:1 n=1 Tax=Cetraspora pellucida TaxID=1433469 RepID=A0A9N8VC71_9GLOM|nr:8214_t:CDS:2 [Cetraspora pellucida]
MSSRSNIKPSVRNVVANVVSNSAEAVGSYVPFLNALNIFQINLN